MNRIFILLIVLIGAGISGYSQSKPNPTIVSTEPQLYQAVLEEYTGIGCGNCPAGQYIATVMNRAQPQKTSLVSIHAGPYAEGSDYTTPEGDSLLKMSGCENYGYPCGTVSRQPFIDGHLYMGRSAWIKSSKEFSSGVSPVNIAATASIDYNSRRIQLLVEVYYTDDDESAINFLTVMLLQSRIIGYQNGGGANYEHNHMLRKVLSESPFGDTIYQTTKGTFLSKTFNFILPDNYGNVPLKVEDIELVAVVARGRTEITTGTTVIPFITNNPMQNAIEIERSYIPATFCGQNMTFDLHNRGEQPVTSMEAKVNFAGNQEQIVQWNGTIAPYSSQKVTFTLPVKPTGLSEYSVNIEKVNGQNNQSSEKTYQSEVKNSIQIPLYYQVELKTDNYGDETTWFIEDSALNKVYEFGPYPPSQVQTDVQIIDLKAGGCYKVAIPDEWGDGIQMPKGSIKFRKMNENKDLIFQETNIKDLGIIFYLNCQYDPDSPSSIFDVTNQHAVNVYPNPATHTLYVENQNQIVKEIELMDIFGRVLKTQKTHQNLIEIDVSSLPFGVYFVRITTESDSVYTKKIVKN